MIDRRSYAPPPFSTATTCEESCEGATLIRCFGSSARPTTALLSSFPSALLSTHTATFQPSNHAVVRVSGAKRAHQGTCRSSWSVYCRSRPTMIYPPSSLFASIDRYHYLHNALLSWSHDILGRLLQSPFNHPKRPRSRDLSYASVSVRPFATARGKIPSLPLRQLRSRLLRSDTSAQVAIS